MHQIAVRARKLKAIQAALSEEPKKGPPSRSSPRVRLKRAVKWSRNIASSRWPWRSPPTHAI